MEMDRAHFKKKLYNGTKQTLDRNQQGHYKRAKKYMEKGTHIGFKDDWQSGKK